MSATENHTQPSQPQTTKSTKMTESNESNESKSISNNEASGIPAQLPVPATAADFETAIEASGFGLFNMLLLLVSAPAAIATTYQTSTMSFVLPSAECDLHLSPLDKGTLNAVTYAGMITSAVLWGYVADVKGRKKLLIYGYIADAICVLGSSLSQTKVQLMIFKFFGGFAISGPFATLMSYLTELHGKNYRQRVMMIVGVLFSLATMSLPGLAMLVLPQKWEINLFGQLTLHSWHIFLTLSALPSILSSTLLPFFPESPKFLMSQGRNAEAMVVFQKIYAMNNRKKRSDYPIKELINEVPQKSIKSLPDEKPHSDAIDAESAGKATKSHTSSLRAGLIQLRPLFVKPYLGLSLAVYLLNFCVLLGHNTMRLWLPQLFVSINEYEQLTTGQPQHDDTSMCQILEFTANRTAHLLQNINSNITSTSITTQIIEECTTVNVSMSSYTNNLIVSTASLLAYTVAGTLVNLVGVKTIMSAGLLVAGCCAAALHWSSSSTITVTLASTFITMGSISAMSVISASVNLFPTALRTMVVSLLMMCGRSGSLLGNIVFPALMSLGCLPPFLMVAFFMLAAGIMSAFLPLKNKAALK